MGLSLGTRDPILVNSLYNRCMAARQLTSIILSEIARVTNKKYYCLIHRDHRAYEGKKSGDPLPFTCEELVALALSAIEVGKCHHCWIELHEYNFSPDHMTALSAGGTSEISNIRIICWDCNKKKGNQSDSLFHFFMSKQRLLNKRAIEMRKLKNVRAYLARQREGEEDRREAVIR